MKHITFILVCLASLASAQNFSLKPGRENEATPEQKAQIRQSLGLEPSTTGGANTIPKYDANGNLITGPFDNAGTLFGHAGNIHMPNRQGIRWLKKDGTLSSANIAMDEDHDAYGGELYINAPFRIAIMAKGPMQMFPNDAARFARLLMLSSGYASNANAALNYMPSAALGWQTSVWNGSTSVRSTIMSQSRHLDTTGTNTILEFFGNAAMGGETNGGSIFDSATGVVTGDLWAQMTGDGFWTVGSHPEATALVDGPTVTWTANKYKAVQHASVTLADNRSLSFSGWENGMRGTIMVKQDGLGGRTLSLPGTANAPVGFALSTGANVTDQLDVFFTGNIYYIRKVASYDPLTDADATAFFSRASISDATQRTAINNLVLGLKGAGLWDKLDALYPFVGGNATAHSKNLLADSRHITWAGTVTHDATGITGNATDGRGVAGFKFQDRGDGQNNAMLYAYCRTAAPTTNGAFVASSGGTGSARTGLRASTASVLASDGLHSAGIGDISIAVSGNDYRKHLAAMRSGASAISVWAGASKNTNTTASTGTTTNNLGILCRNNGVGYDQYSNANLAMVMIGQALSDSEYATFRSLVDAYQTALSRANP